jgi:ATP-dependent DNA helicase RecQ
LTIQQLLQQYWGYTAFRPLQEDIITAVLNNKDALALLPTGGGKSLCYQVPGMARPGLCLVISPLIALMKDQVEQLQRRNIPALSIYSGMSFLEVKKTLQNAAYGNYKFLYVSPERLETKLFLEYLPALNINLIAVDEAHCISQWGYDFRPPYLRIAALRQELPLVPILAVTASATEKVQQDICDKLEFASGYCRFQQSFERPALSYSAFNVPAKQIKLLEILQHVGGSAIVYCKSRKQTKDVADILRMNNINADYYHAGLSNNERNRKQQQWIENKIRVIVCTNAFGMGIDKPDVRVVVHYDVPDCIENYYQEAGRAGRDGKRAYAVLLFNGRELEDLQQQSNIRFPDEATIRTVYTGIMNHLQVPAGAGEDLSYDFDIAAFANHFKLNILTITYAIKALEQEGILTYNDMVLKPATVVFTAGKTDVTEFEHTHTSLQELIKGLLRSYGGIFDYPVTVYESQLAKFINKDVKEVKKQLQTLNDYKIIAYAPQKDKPQLTLLQNRMYNDSYFINTVNYLQRKKNFEQRINAIIKYANDCDNCRSNFIATYFSAPLSNACGICDNCINHNAISVSPKEFAAIAADIFTLVNKNAVSLKEIQQALSKIKKEKIVHVLNYLQTENKIKFNRDGLLEPM